MKNSYRSIWLFALVFLCILLGCACSRKNREVLVLLESQTDASYDELQTAARQWTEGKIILEFITLKTDMILTLYRYTFHPGFCDRLLPRFR